MLYNNLIDRCIVKPKEWFDFARHSLYAKEISMTATTISPKFQVVIPKEVREQIPLKSGQKVTMIAKNGVIHIVPGVSLKKLKGALKGLPPTGFRDKKDRL